MSNWLPTYHKRNMKNISKLSPATRILTTMLYQRACKKEVDILIYETIRTEKKQRENVQKGVSKTMKSYHLVGQALDFVPIKKDGQADWDGYDDHIIKDLIRYAKSIGFHWGGDWETFKDKPHLEYWFKGYGTDKEEPTKKKKFKVVKAGDSLSKLFPSNWSEVALKNRIEPPYTIKVGQKIYYEA